MNSTADRAEPSARPFERPKGVKINDAQLGAVKLTPHAFHGEWNYTISPIRSASIRRRKVE
jgi:hypothetical protein